MSGKTSFGKAKTRKKIRECKEKDKTRIELKRNKKSAVGN